MTRLILNLNGSPATELFRVEYGIDISASTLILTVPPTVEETRVSVPKWSLTTVATPNRSYAAPHWQILVIAVALFHWIRTLRPLVEKSAPCGMTPIKKLEMVVPEANDRNGVWLTHASTP